MPFTEGDLRELLTTRSTTPRTLDDLADRAERSGRRRRVIQLTGTAVATCAAVVALPVLLHHGGNGTQVAPAAASSRSPRPDDLASRKMAQDLASRRAAQDLAGLKAKAEAALFLCTDKVPVAKPIEISVGARNMVRVRAVCKGGRVMEIVCVQGAAAAKQPGTMISTKPVLPPNYLWAYKGLTCLAAKLAATASPTPIPSVSR